MHPQYLSVVLTLEHRSCPFLPLLTPWKKNSRYKQICSFSSFSYHLKSQNPEWHWFCMKADYLGQSVSLYMIVMHFPHVQCMSPWACIREISLFIACTFYSTLILIYTLHYCVFGILTKATVLKKIRQSSLHYVHALHAEVFAEWS